MNWLAPGNRALVGLPLAALWVAGCSSLPLERLHMRQYAQEFTYTQDVATAMKASRAALEQLGFTLDSGSESQGRMEMVSRPLAGNTAQTALQRRAIVSVTWTSEGMSLVRIGFWNESEDPSQSESVPPSGRLIKEGALYDAFWQRMDEALPPDSSLPAPEAGSGTSAPVPPSPANSGAP